MNAAGVTAQARLSADQSQAVFRWLLDALSRPGLPVPMPPGLPADIPPVLLGPLALADVDTSVAVVGDGAWDDVIRTATGSRSAALAEADMVVALRPPTPDQVLALRRGSTETPELGARLFVGCPTLRGRNVLRIAGPGVPGEQRVAVEGVPAEVFTAIAAANRGFPAGIDTWLVAGDGSVVGLPRSSRVTIEEVG